MSSDAQTGPPAPEFSRPLPLASLGRGAEPFDLVATPAERAALARRFRLPAVHRLSARGTVGKERGGRLIVVEGVLEGAVTQTCVVTLEPVENTVSEPFRIAFVAGAEAPGEEVVIDPEDPDAPEPLEEDPLDLGELVAQHFSLALDPYPRRSQAPFSLVEDPPGRQDADSPFAALRTLKPEN